MSCMLNNLKPNDIRNLKSLNSSNQERRQKIFQVGQSIFRKRNVGHDAMRHRVDKMMPQRNVLIFEFKVGKISEWLPESRRTYNIYV